MPTLLVKGSLKSYKGEADQRELDQWLPVDYISNWFTTRLSQTGTENRLLILLSETASGKSTALPPVLTIKFVLGNDNPKAPGIICTQPRVLTAITNVLEMQIYNSVKLPLGERMGWSTGSNKLNLTKPGLLSATVGVLMAQLKTLSDDEIMKTYRMIMIDETHERSVDVDIVCYLLKGLLQRQSKNPACPFVVLMSATFDPHILLRYYGVSHDTNFIHCVGASQPRKLHWDWNGDYTSGNWIRSVGDVIMKICRENVDDDVDCADVLIFLPGQLEYKELAIELGKCLDKLVAEQIPVFSLMYVESNAVKTENDDYKKMMFIATHDQTVTIKGVDYRPNRRVICSTAVAETGLTLDALKYVIDVGFDRGTEYNPHVGISALLTKAAPRSRITQRIGRIGRKKPGEFYPIYPKWIFDRVPEQQLPSILLSDATQPLNILIEDQIRTKYILGDRDPLFKYEELDMVNPPCADSTWDAIEKLHLLGLVTQIGSKWYPDKLEYARKIGKLEPGEIGRFGPTLIGSLINMITAKIPIESVRMIIAGYCWNVPIVDMVTIAIWITGGMNDMAMPTENIMNPIHIKWREVYKYALPDWFDPQLSSIQVRALTGCQFIDGLFFYNAMCKVSHSLPGDMNKFREWCESVNVKLDKVISFTQMRDELIEQFIIAGFDVGRPQWTWELTEDMFVEWIKRIKHCIYDGYKHNILQYTGQNGIYITRSGYNVIPGKWTNAEDKTVPNVEECAKINTTYPQYMICKGLKLKQDRLQPLLNSIQMDMMSVMDGFVPVDLGLLD